MKIAPLVLALLLAGCGLLDAMQDAWGNKPVGQIEWRVG